MATQKQDETQGDGGSGGQTIAVQRGPQDQRLSRDRIPSARRIARTRPFAMMRRMLDDLDDISPFGAARPFGMVSPFSTMRRMFDEMERMFDTDLTDEADWGASRDYIWAPRIEVRQREDKLLVRADLPGMSQDQIQISADNDSLVIEGERVLSSDQQDDVVCAECVQGRFRRAIGLPQGADLDRAEARYENGVLEISVPVPATQTRGRRIEIQSAGTTEGRARSQPENAPAQQQPAETR